MHFSFVKRIAEQIINRKLEGGVEAAQAFVEERFSFSDEDVEQVQHYLEYEGDE